MGLKSGVEGVWVTWQKLSSTTVLVRTRLSRPWLLFSARSLDHLPQRVKMEDTHSPVGWWESSRHTRCQAAASPLSPCDPHLWFANSRERLKTIGISIIARRWGKERRRLVCFALLKKTCQTPSVSLSTELRPCPSSCGLPHQDYKDGRRGEPNKQVLFSAPMRESRGHWHATSH